MTFIELTSLLAFTTPLFCAMSTGWKAGHWIGAMIGLLVGLVLGMGTLCGFRLFSRWIARHPRLSATHPGAFYLGLAYLLCAGLFLWIVGFSFLALCLTNFLVHQSI